jgi:hypothetical protein
LYFNCSNKADQKKNIQEIEEKMSDNVPIRKYGLKSEIVEVSGNCFWPKILENSEIRSSELSIEFFSRKLGGKKRDSFVCPTVTDCISG